MDGGDRGGHAVWREDERLIDVLRAESSERANVALELRAMTESVARSDQRLGATNRTADRAKRVLAVAQQRIHTESS